MPGNTMLDVVFAVGGRSVPADHGYLLALALLEVLPWLESEPLAGVHPIHGADNGRDMLILSHRTKLVLRLPQHRVEEAQQLGEKSLDLAGHELRVGEPALRPLSSMTTLHARFVVTGSEGEMSFCEDVARELEQEGIRGQFICGRRHVLQQGETAMVSYSLMVHGLTQEHSLRLQQQGLGLGRKLGCGVFVPHKSIQAVYTP